jgi:hypothetical protein
MMCDLSSDLIGSFFLLEEIRFTQTDDNGTCLSTTIIKEQHPFYSIMKTFYSLAIACLAVGTTTSAYSTSTNNNNNKAPSRRAFFQKAAVTAAAASAAVLLPTQAAQAAEAALDACPAKSQNCIRTTWTPPAGTSKAKMAEQVKAVLQAYPQEGQSKVDLGGWEIVEDGLDKGLARVEYKSGLGNFAKFLNGNKPFVDDLKIEITDKTVELRSSSRIGESDLGVNQKRLTYLANAIKAVGWEAAEPKY